MATGDQCELDWMNPTNPLAFRPPQDCKQGSVPNFYIDVRSANDIVAALKFSKSTGVRLVVKKLGLLSHNPRFVPAGCSLKMVPQSAVTYAAGSQFQEVYQFAYDHNLTLVGGSDQSVGAAGGWHQGGGHSPLSPTLGMGADRALQYKIVTPDGVLRTANACQNSDLFWALRGGGGGTFGVVLELTAKATPAHSYQVANINWPVTNANLRQVMSVYIDNATMLAKQGWGGYLTPTEGNIILINSKLSTKQAQESMHALISLTQKLGGVSNVTQVPTFLDWFNEWVGGVAGDQDSIGLPIAMGSRLIPQANHALQKAEHSSWKPCSTPLIVLLFPIIVNPMWRTSLYHNEAAVHEPNYQSSFWNSKYQRLLQIKNKYDPERVFDCWQCGKGNHWMEGQNSPQYKCYI
ncbi:hypothetical protein CPB84DRAFT_1787219 [Gymnopilus junonius]|uniref:FAD-binding PCMH-type domain-containing protein n=1 Tax=Gymnopilus junonius TaxID=109634 RepID=A0A9P5NF51_GYMJU|nr:hypothetical protein CPB84DRAFT_1787219 [Gymnopilus junonius]